MEFRTALFSLHISGFYETILLVDAGHLPTTEISSEESLAVLTEPSAAFRISVRYVSAGYSGEI